MNTEDEGNENGIQNVIPDGENAEEGENPQDQEPLLDSQGNIINPDDDKPKVPTNPLKLELLKKSLQKLSKTYDGLSYAYTKIDIKEKELDDIGEDLENYVHLRDVDLSKNKFPQINPVESMTYLVTLDANTNEIRDMEIFKNPNAFQFLQVLNLSQNKIKELPEMHAKYLTDLNLEGNKINNCGNFTGLPKVRKLNLNQNKLQSCNGLANMPEIEVIYLNQNRIKTLEGLSNLPSLRKLRLRTNRIVHFHQSLPELPHLEKLAISENLVKDLLEFSYLKFPNLTKINVDGNPVFDEAKAGAKTEILIQLEDLPYLKFINKDEVTLEDREEAKKVKEERIENERQEALDRERERLEREEQERIENLERLQREKEEQEERERLEKEERERLEQEKEEQLRLAKERGEIGEDGQPISKDGENKLEGEAENQKEQREDSNAEESVRNDNNVNHEQSEPEDQ